MSRRIHQVQQIVLSLVVIDHGTCLRFDSNTSLAFNIQFVQHLLVHPRLDSPREFEQSIGECAFAMIDVCDDAEVAVPVNGNIGDAAFDIGIGFARGSLRPGAPCCRRSEGP